MPFLNASSSAAVTGVETGDGLVPPLASRSGKPPRAPAEATVWLDCFCSLDDVLNLPRRPLFFFGSSLGGAGFSFFFSPPASPADAVDVHRDLRDRLGFEVDHLRVARFSLGRRGQLLGRDLLFELGDAILGRRVRREHAVALLAARVAGVELLQHIDQARPVRSRPCWRAGCRPCRPRSRLRG